jgi:hypothetical protein
MPEHCYAECRLFLVSFMLSVRNKPFLLRIIMLSVIRLSVITLSVITLSVIMLSVIMQSVMAPNNNLQILEKAPILPMCHYF